MKVDVILGLQWGDEGKGKIVDALAPGYDIIARFQGGPNAGHTIMFNDRKFVLHSVPSGIFRKEILNVIGNGVVLDPFIFFKEIDEITAAGFDPTANLIISQNAHLIMPTHRLLDAVNEAAMGDRKIGSTLKGIGPTYTDKYNRTGLRTGNLLSDSFMQEYELRKAVHFRMIQQSGIPFEQMMLDGLSFEAYEQEWLKAAERLKQFKICATEIKLNQALAEGKKVLAEGAQGTLLDVDFGSYPFVTSSNTSTGGVCTGLGIAPNKIGKVFGIFKAYCTRVGNGPFPTELFDDMGELIRKNGHEFGATTGRPRRTGWLDLPALRYSVMLNGVTDLIMTKADVLSGIETIQVCESYTCGNRTHVLPEIPFGREPGINISGMTGWKEDLSQISDAAMFPAAFSTYFKYIEQQVGVKLSYISTGPERNQLIKM